VAATKLFSTVGYTSTSIADIVTEAGTSVGLLYYHFGNKKALFLAIWSEYQKGQRELTAAAIEAAKATGLTGPDLVSAGIRAYLEGAWANREILPMAHGTETPPGFGKIVEGGGEGWNRQMVALLSTRDRRMTRLALLMLNDALSAVCLNLSTCANDRQAGATIDSAVRLSRSLLAAVPAG
jgi:AcrR family transcriptional regulator